MAWALVVRTPGLWYGQRLEGHLLCLTGNYAVAAAFPACCALPSFSPPPRLHHGSSQFCLLPVAAARLPVACVVRMQHSAAPGLGSLVPGLRGRFAAFELPAICHAYRMHHTLLSASPPRFSAYHAGCENTRLLHSPRVAGSFLVRLRSFWDWFGAAPATLRTAAPALVRLRWMRDPQRFRVLRRGTPLRHALRYHRRRAALPWVWVHPCGYAALLRCGAHACTPLVTRSRPAVRFALRVAVLAFHQQFLFGSVVHWLRAPRAGSGRTRTRLHLAFARAVRTRCHAHTRTPS